MNFNSWRKRVVNSCIVYVSFSIKSHLFTTTTTLFHSSRMKPAMWASWAVTPLVASTISSATSARFMANNARSTLYFSTPGTIRPRRRMPAVSIKVIGMFSWIRFVSTASRVVPGIGLTIARSFPRILFSRLDLPTFGFPTMAILIESSSISAVCSMDVLRAVTRTSNKSPVPVPCRAEIG